MNELPILVIEKILSYMSLAGRLKCKLISKQWKLAVETAVGPQSLCIFELEYPYKLKWCFSEQNVIQEDIIQSWKEFRNLNSRIDLFKDLQKLCFFHVELKEFIEDLHLLKRLKVLIIYGYFIHGRGRDGYRIAFKSISLEKIAIKFKKLTSRIESLDFDTPNLNSLIFDNYFAYSDREVKYQVNFRCPLKVRYLECIEFDSQLSVLKNLETLVTQTITCPFSLKDYKSLKRLELFPRKTNELDHIRAILNEKRDLKRDALEITVCGFRDVLIALKQEDANIYLSVLNLNQYFLGQVAKYQDLVGYIPWEVNLDFGIFNKVSKKLPKNFFTKFYSISLSRFPTIQRERNSFLIRLMFCSCWLKLTQKR